MDGFDQSVNVKVIMATNRQDTLDPALLRTVYDFLIADFSKNTSFQINFERPGRLDRKIEFPLPDRRQKRLVFSTITSKMNLSHEVDLEDFIARPDKISGAEICSICQEAGMIAVRENRYVVMSKGIAYLWFIIQFCIFSDFEKAYKSQLKNKDEMEHEFYH